MQSAPDMAGRGAGRPVVGAAKPANPAPAPDRRPQLAPPTGATEQGTEHAVRVRGVRAPHAARTCRLRARSAGCAGGPGFARGRSVRQHSDFATLGMRRMLLCEGVLAMLSPQIRGGDIAACYNGSAHRFQGDPDRSLANPRRRRLPPAGTRRIGTPINRHVLPCRRAAGKAGRLRAAARRTLPSPLAGARRAGTRRPLPHS